LTITTISNGFNTAYAKHNSIRVDCKDLAITLITWDQLLAMTDANERLDIEDNLGEDGVTNGVFDDKHLDDLVDEVKDECNNLNSDTEDYLDDMELEIP
jgi:hypothetical protein